MLVPLAWTALLSGAIMAWAVCWASSALRSFFAGNFPGRTQTMPLAIYIGFELDLNTALTMSIILVIWSFFVLLVVRGILHREVESVDL